MSAVEALASLVRAQAANIEQQRAVAVAVLRRLTNARDGLQAATADARSELIERSIRALAVGIEALEHAVADLGAVLDSLAAYGPALGFDLGAGAGGSGAAAVRPPAKSPAPPDRMTWIRDAGAGLPLRPADAGPTHGRLFDLAGTELTDSQLTHPSGYLRSGLVADARDGLDPNWYPGARVIGEHVESHAAAILRRPGSPQQAVLVINKPTCRSRRRYVGCDQVIPGMLPAGKSLIVFVTDGQETRLMTAYLGTGEGISS